MLYYDEIDRWGPVDMTLPQFYPAGLHTRIDIGGMFRIYYPEWNIVTTQTRKEAGEGGRIFIYVELSHHGQSYSARYVLHTDMESRGKSHLVNYQLYEATQGKSWKGFTAYKFRAVVALFWACILLVDNLGQVPALVSELVPILTKLCRENGLDYEIKRPRLMDKDCFKASVNSSGYAIDFCRSGQLVHRFCVKPSCWNNYRTPHVNIDGVAIPSTADYLWPSRNLTGLSDLRKFGRDMLLSFLSPTSQ